jgi:hypothetical protein
MMEPGSRDTNEGDGIVCCRLELEEEERSNFEKNPSSKLHRSSWRRSGEDDWR